MRPCPPCRIAAAWRQAQNFCAAIRVSPACSDQAIAMIEHQVVGAERVLTELAIGWFEYGPGKALELLAATGWPLSAAAATVGRFDRLATSASASPELRRAQPGRTGKPTGATRHRCKAFILGRQVVDLWPDLGGAACRAFLVRTVQGLARKACRQPLADSRDDLAPPVPWVDFLAAQALLRCHRTEARQL
jgi:hypothetical protein